MNRYYNNWDPTSRQKSIAEAWPFVGLLVGLGLLIGGLIWLMEILN